MLYYKTQPHFLKYREYWRGHQKMGFIYKKVCIYSYLFKLQSLSKYSPFDAIHLWRHFLHYSKVFELVEFDAF